MKTYLFRAIQGLWQEFIEANPVQLPQSDKWLATYYRRHHEHGKRDRQVLTALFFGILRHALWALYCQLKPFQLEEWIQADPHTVYRALRELPLNSYLNWILFRLEDLHELTPELRKQAKGFQSALSKLPNGDLIWNGAPLCYAEAIQTRETLSGPHWRSGFLKNLNSRPPIWLRVQKVQDLQKIEAELVEAGLKILAQVPLSQGLALSVEGEKGIYELTGYKTGLFEIQDLASQWVGDAVPLPAKGGFILDACAGAGGKTMQLASRSQGKGAIYAVDIREYKLAEIQRRAKRAQAHNIRILPWDWTQENLPSFPKEIEKQGGFHVALVDAPCSASGTWRRNPDAKWRFALEDLEKLHHLQLTILGRTAQVVKPGGYLVYATCSFIPSENEGVVANFLAKNPDFSAVSAKLLGSPEANSDTLFVAVMQRTANSNAVKPNDEII